MTCEYCGHGEGNWFMPDSDGRQDAAYIDTHNLLVVRFKVRLGIYAMVPIPIEYCPKCGRKLDE